MGRKIPVKQTLAQLRNASEEITKSAEKVAACVMAMEQNGIEVIEPAHFGQFVEAQQFISLFTASVYNQIFAQRKEKNDFGTILGPAIRSKSKPKKKSK